MAQANDFRNQAKRSAVVTSPVAVSPAVTSPGATSSAVAASSPAVAVSPVVTSPVVTSPAAYKVPVGCNAVLALADGTVHYGQGAGKHGICQGELCFNTSMTGYQEVITDPSYTDQIVVFTFPHIGNTGANSEDNENATAAARGIVLTAPITRASNVRSQSDFADWCKSQNITVISGIDTRALTISLRDGGALNAAIHYDPNHRVDGDAATKAAQSCPDMRGLDLAGRVSCQQSYRWEEGVWQPVGTTTDVPRGEYNVVVIDFGVKRNILRSLVSTGCRVTVVPAQSTVESILAHQPDGIVLSNGPGDPQATAQYASPVIQSLIKKDMPIFGICLGHQLLALSLGARTVKMHHGHRGTNHPVRNLATNRVEITSQNHGFVVDPESLPQGVRVTHQSLFDATLEGIEVENKEIFSVQHHPEASPGPRDASYLFERFRRALEHRH